MGRPTRYTPDDKALVLRTLALYGGNARRTADALQNERVNPGPDTIRKFRDEDPVLYEQFVYEMRQSIGQRVSDDAMELAQDAHNVERALVAETYKKMEEIPAGGLAKAALSLSQVKKNNVETARLLRNEPTAITEVREVSETLDELAALGVIDVTAEEVEEG